VIAQASAPDVNSRVNSPANPGIIRVEAIAGPV
jgi:hypothetical protein